MPETAEQYESVDVRTFDDSDEPMAFVWRNRIYVVGDVLGRWKDGDLEVWRVEASSGRRFGNGVYDLHQRGQEWRLNEYPHPVVLR